MKKVKYIFDVDSNERMTLVTSTEHYDGDELIATKNHRAVMDPSDHNYKELLASAVEKIVPAINLAQEVQLQEKDTEIQSERSQKVVASDMCAKHEATIVTLEKVVTAQESKIQELNSRIKELEGK